MPESFRTRLMRWRFNWHPAYRRSGGRIEYIDVTLREVRMRLPLNRGTRNLNGTIYGGSIYAAVDPIHAVMLVSLLGPADYVCWTKEATVRFRRQARTDLSATFRLDASEVDAVRAEVERSGKVERRYPVEMFDRDGRLCVECDVLVHIHARPPATRPASTPAASAPALASTK